MREGCCGTLLRCTAQEPNREATERTAEEPYEVRKNPREGFSLSQGAFEPVGSDSRCPGFYHTLGNPDVAPLLGIGNALNDLELSLGCGDDGGWFCWSEAVWNTDVDALVSGLGSGDSEYPAALFEPAHPFREGVLADADAAHDGCVAGSAFTAAG